ncbi:MAG: hypothetical protein WD029_09045 [Microthrixaceae bacterium]
MKALLAKIPRDKSMLLLLAPVLVLGAFFVASRSQPSYSALPVGVTVAPATTTSTVLPVGSEAEVTVGSEQAADSSATAGVGRSARTSGSARSSGSSGPAFLQGSNNQVAEVAGEQITNTSAPTTTLPDSGNGGPEPTVSESPIAVLLPVTALLALGASLIFILRRRNTANRSLQV